MSRRLTASMASVICVLWLIAGEAAAQGGRRLEGRLIRPDGTVLAGVTVTVGGTRTSTVSDREGRFVLTPVPTGTFPVILSLGRHVLSVDVHFDGPQGTLDRTLDWDVAFGETITVSAASRQAERLFDAPASVAVVDEATIGLEAPQAQVPKLLAAVPGLELTQSGIFDFNLNIRGLNAALTRRVLTLIDGRDASSVLIGAQEWAAFGLPLDELSRIEIVRGPGAALYGANAFNGVIDITTKPPKVTQGGHAEVALGELGTRRLSMRYAGLVGARASYRVHGVYGRTDDWYESRNVTTEYPGLPREVQGLARDRTVFSNTGARLDFAFSDARSATLEGGWAYTDGSVFLTGAGRIQNTGAHRPWVRAAWATRSWRASLYYDGRFGEMASLSAGGTIVDRSGKVNAETQRLFSLASGTRIVVGGAYRFLHADTRDDSRQSTLLRGVQRAHEGSVFGQIQHPLSRHLRAVFALRLDDSTLHGPEVSPKAALVYAPNPAHSFRVSYGHAFQTGSFVHYFTRTPAAPPVSLAGIEAALAPVLGGVPLGFGSVPVLALGNDTLQVERVNSVEGGYTGVYGNKVMVNVNAYYNRIDQLITPLIAQVGTELGRINPSFQPYVPPAELSAAQQAIVLSTLRSALPPASFALLSNDLDGAPIFAAASYTNLAGSRLEGAEFGVQYFATSRITGDLGYAALDFEPADVLVDPLVTANAPPHAVTLGVTYTDSKISASVRYRWFDAFPWNGGAFRGEVPAASVVDLSARYRLTARTTIQVNLSNLFNNEHYEIFGGDLLRRRVLASLSQTW